MASIQISQPDADFAKAALLNWFKTAGRDFPWRHFRSPYNVLISELMLRRTQARQVVDVYIEFLRIYPDVASLNLASEDQIDEILYPLGLRWRAKNFKAIAHELVINYQGDIPDDRDTLLSLPGVGPYVADAVRCFAFGHSATLADTNTVRVAARYFGFEYTPESRRRRSVVEVIATLIVSIPQPNQITHCLILRRWFVKHVIPTAKIVHWRQNAGIIWRQKRGKNRPLFNFAYSRQLFITREKQ